MAFLYKKVLEQITIMSYSAITLSVRLNWRDCLTDFLGHFSEHPFLSVSGHKKRYLIQQVSEIILTPQMSSVLFCVSKDSPRISRKNFAECATKGEDEVKEDRQKETLTVLTSASR